MKIDLAKVNYDGEWFVFADDAKVKIRAFPRSRSKVKVIDGALIFSGADTMETFKYCLMEWEGFVDSNEKPIKLSDGIKEKIFDSGIKGLADFVIARNADLQKRILDEEKN
jgi:hypothetical protein